MNRHVEQEGMLHLVAEAAKVVAHVVVTVQGGQRPQRAGQAQRAQAAHIGLVTAVLGDGEQAAGDLGGLDQPPRPVQRVGHRLFRQHMAAVGQRSQRHLNMAHRGGAIEDQVGARFIQETRQVRTHSGLRQTKFLRAPRRRPVHQVHQPDHLDLGNLLRYPQPGRTDAAAADQNGSQRHRHTPS